VQDETSPDRRATTESARATGSLPPVLAGRTWWQRFAFWLLAFGVWVLLRWPSSPGTRDLLFLLPNEWWAPVWQPVLVSCVSIAAGVLILLKTRRACPHAGTPVGEASAARA
jgi:hypothetical protein